MSLKIIKYFFWFVVGFFVVSISAVSYAEQNNSGGANIDTISVTATREERLTKDVPNNIVVVGEERIEESRMYNISDALKGIPSVLLNSKNGGYDARMIIRGAGLKANYGIREIMLLRDGVPITDPDSFTRLDFIDTQDVERIEITKGPGNIYALGSAGGTVQIVSNSVFDNTGNRVKLGLGNYGTKNLHLRAAGSLDKNEQHWTSATYSGRAVDNDWRHWNEFSSNQLSLKYGTFFSSDTVLETELSYTRSDLQLPGGMSETQYNEFVNTGKQTDNNSAFKHSGRYSDVWFFNSRLEKQFVALTFKPRLYFNYWSHYHPVTGAINDTTGVSVLGTDLEFSYGHKFWGASNLVAGLTLKRDRNSSGEKYKYRDVQTIPAGPQAGRITATLSDTKGDLIETQDETNTVYGIFLQESMHPTQDWLVDVGFRLDSINLQQHNNEMETYDFATGTYVQGEGLVDLDRTFTLFSPSLGVSYALTKRLSLFTTAAQGEQVPFSNELDKNPELNASTARSFEVGLKGRATAWEFDTSVYVIKTSEEIIAVLENDETTFQNAGKTDKQGFEFAGSGRLAKNATAGELWLGANYAYSDYTYTEFNEAVRGQVVDHSGNQLPFVPEHQYGMFVTWQHMSGVRLRLQSESWGEYFIDNANTESYTGYDFVASLNIAYERGSHSLSANIHNLSDKRYAVEVKKDSNGKKTYTAGTPRNFLVAYQYDF